ncbi:MAG: hypothetical protein EA409_02895 [Saprospirales bacterium]|nr:MAG: hypothetical protein EA409_02895 [Saprospirales bacterium]
MIKILISLILSIPIFILACGPTGDPSKAAGERDTGPLPLSAGKSIFSTHCVVCHGTDGRLGLNEAGDLTESILSLEERKAIISQGKGTMIAYNRILSSREIEAVAKYTFQLQEKGKDED